MSTNELNILLMVLGGMLLLLELFSNYFKINFFISEPIVALVFGIFAGPSVFGFLELGTWGDPIIILKEIARITVAITLIGVAFRLPNRFIPDNKKDMVVLILIVLPCMWVVSGFLTYFILGLPIWIALLIGAAVAPTDPVVAGVIVTGDTAERNIPEGVRHLISAESAANDALAFPFVMVPVLFLGLPAADAFRDLVLNVVIWEVLGAVLGGIILGYIAGRLLLWTERHPDVERRSLIAVTFSLALATLGMVKLLHSDALLAVFACGVTMNLVIGNKFDPKSEHVEEIIKRFIDLPIFFLFGLALPWNQWLEIGWPLVALAVLILFFRRLPAILVTRRLIGQLKTLGDNLFAGWFGPIGVAAIFYATLASEKSGEIQVWIIGSFIIFASVIMHGVTDMPFTKLYGKRNQDRT
jgi:NhaP-type Na+/H+ or K+/H+ antiporter